MAGELPEKPRFSEWFEPAKFFAEGYPRGVSSALRVFPEIAFEIQRIIVTIHPRRVIEIGPGDRPLVTGVRGAVYLDVLPRFLKRAAGRGVVGDVREAPFKPGSFDLAVAADVLTHVPPPDRELALAEIMALAPRVLIFSPEEGTPEVTASPVSTENIVAAMEDAGWEVEQKRYVVPAKVGAYRMALLYGEKPT